MQNMKAISALANQREQLRLKRSKLLSDSLSSERKTNLRTDFFAGIYLFIAIAFCVESFVFSSSLSHNFISDWKNANLFQSVEVLINYFRMYLPLAAITGLGFLASAMFQALRESALGYAVFALNFLAPAIPFIIQNF